MRKKSIYIGITVLTAIVIIFIVSIYMNKLRLGSNNNYVLVKFSNINGLRTDDEVRLMGVKCGRVASVDLMDDYVLVKLQLNRNIEISSNSIAGIHDYAVIGGTKYVLIYPASGPDYAYPADTIAGESYDFSLAKISILLDDIKNIIEETIPSSETVQGVIDSLNAAIAGVNEIINVTGEGIEEITYNINDASRSINVLIDSLNESMNIVTGQLKLYEENENALKSITTSDSLYIKLQRSIDRLESVLNDISRNRFLKGCL